MKKIESELSSGKGKKSNQRMQHYLVLQYLMRHTDENHFCSADDVAEYLKKDCGIYSERRSIYKDIREINIANVMVNRSVTHQKAVELLDEKPELATVGYKKNCGYYVARRPISLKYARLIAECAYTTRFITDEQNKRIVRGISNFLSEHQRSEIEHEAFFVGRARTNNKELFDNVNLIHKAMASQKSGEYHEPEKISFKYLKCTIQNRTQSAQRRGGNDYIFSPHAIMINDGNYYVLGIDEKYDTLRTYRIDRMSDVKLTGEPRRETDETRNLNEYLDTYPQRVFSMYGGKKTLVRIRFTNDLLDTVVERFGNYASYFTEDKNHFTVSVTVEISPTFFGWLCGFGVKAKLISPSPIIEDFTKYLARMQGMYNKEEKRES